MNEGNKNAMIHGYGSRNNKHKLCGVRSGMIKRCGNPNEEGYKYYGGRGIIVCDEWKNNAASFIEWGLANGWEDGLHIDRIDNNGYYCPENCHFVTQAENNRNQRIRKDNKTGYRGVAQKYHNRWEVVVAGKYIGLYVNKIDAAVSRDSYVISNNIGLPLNFPQPIVEINKGFYDDKEAQKNSWIV